MIALRHNKHTLSTTKNFISPVNTCYMCGGWRSYWQSSGIKYV